MRTRWPNGSEHMTNILQTTSLCYVCHFVWEILSQLWKKQSCKVFCLIKIAYTPSNTGSKHTCKTRSQVTYFCYVFSSTSSSELLIKDPVVHTVHAQWGATTLNIKLKYLKLCRQSLCTRDTYLFFLNVCVWRGWSRRLKRRIRTETDSWTSKRSTNFFTSWMSICRAGRSNKCFRSEYGTTSFYLLLNAIFYK